MITMKDLNYFPLDVESNIYTMTKLEFEDRTSQLLVATLDCRIFCINYSKFKPHTREVEFTYIPNGAKIIAINALKRDSDDYVIGVTHSLGPIAQKSTTRTSTSGFSSHHGADYGRYTTYYFNIYANNSIANCGSFDLDFVAQGCQPVRLRFVPYHLYPSELLTYADSRQSKIVRKPYWLLSGGDQAVHAYCEDKSFQSFNEIPIEDCFPELKNLPGIVLNMDIMNLENQDMSKIERLVALGFEDGSIALYQSVLSISRSKYQLIRRSTFDEYSTIIPSVKLFRTSSHYKSQLSKVTPDIHQHSDQKMSAVNLLAVSSTNPSLIFKNVIKDGLDTKYPLVGSQRFDCSVASAVGDINFDGFEEILIGTHGRELLTYEYDKSSELYQLKQTQELNHSIFAISILDLTKDAMKDVAIMLVSGILLMQASVEDALTTCRRRVDRLMSLLEN